MPDKIALEVGQEVVILTGYRARPTRGKVAKIGRAWIDVTPDGKMPDRNYPTSRFRLDTQTDGSGVGSPARFYTLDQWAEREREIAASKFLQEQGIDLRFGSPWRKRAVELADLIRPHIA